MSRLSAWRLGLGVLVSSGRPGGSRFLRSGALAMALGLVPLVVVLAVADGMIDSISSRTLETALYHLQIWPRGAPQGDPDATGARLRQALGSVAGLRGVWPEQQGFALAYAPSGRRLGLAVRGIDPRWLSEDPGLARYLRADEGRLDPGGAWLGREAGTRLGLRPGDEVKILTLRTRGGLSVPRVTTLRVTALVSVGYQDLDRLWLFLPLRTTLTLFDPQENPVFWGVKSDRPLTETRGLAEAVRGVLPPGDQVVTWQQTGRSQFLNYQATRSLLVLILGLLLVVAAANITTSMGGAVASRRAETAVLRALGASPGLVLRSFLVAGLGAGLAGAATGLALGLVTALLLNPLLSTVDALVTAVSGQAFHLLDHAYYLETLSLRFDAVTLAAAALGTVALSVLASVVPAWRASRDAPLEALRRS